MLGRRKTPKQLERKRVEDEVFLQRLRDDELPAPDPLVDRADVCELHDLVMFERRLSGQPRAPQGLWRCPECIRLEKVKQEADARRTQPVEVAHPAWPDMKLSERAMKALAAYEDRLAANPAYTRPGSAEEADGIIRADDAREAARAKEEETPRERRRRHEREMLRSL